MIDLENLDVAAITQAQRDAEKKVSGLTTDQWRYLRNRAKMDLFFLCTGVLNFNLLSKNLHGHLCTWMKLTEDEQFREILLPRGHYKSTVATISDGIQIALPDDSGDAPWPRNLGTNVRQLIAHEVHEQAGRFLGSIAGHFLGNPVLMGLFPECVPNPKHHRINKFELELPRTEIWSEPTFDTMGVGGRSQGRHYNYIKADDLIGDKARDSATEMQSAKDWFDNIQSFFSTFSKDHIDVIGTRWAFDDLYSHIHKIYGDQLKKYIRAVEELNEKGERVAIFPEGFPLEKLTILRKNRKVWTAQYINDPKEGAAEFDPTWKRHYYWVSQSVLAYRVGNDIEIRVKVSDLDITVLYDPAMRGNCGYLVTGADSKDKIYILDAQKKQWQPPEAMDYLFKSVLRWNPRLVAIEDVNFSGLYQHWLPREMQLRNIRFKVIPVKTRSKEKDSRVRGLSNYFSAGRIYWHEGMVDFEEEFDRFGASDDIHMLDALAYGPEVWKPGLARETWESYRKAEEALMEERDIDTGYSQIY